ncbi:MAG: G5 domain-containing protein [Clostridia bacterium]|nr:G5 domain-containing protein [Clostridia bacterium]
MRKEEKASVSALKIIAISIVFIFCSGIVVAATNLNIYNVKIQFANNYELNVLTTKLKVKDILQDNHIIIADNEVVKPSLNDNIDVEKTIRITKSSEINQEEQPVAFTNLEDIISNYGIITEEIVKIQEEIPFETITKEVSGVSDGLTRIIQEGQNGLREITYKITYKDGEEIAREELSSVIIKEPVEKIVQINNKQTSRSEVVRTPQPTSSTAATLKAKVEGITPKVVTLNTSAYTEAECGKKPTDPGYGKTASGAYVQEWYTVAAGKCYPMGTIIYVPYFANCPNEGWFVVQDRGGAIKNNKLDVYMTTVEACKQFGRRNLECYIYEL